MLCIQQAMKTAERVEEENKTRVKELLQIARVVSEVQNPQENQELLNVRTDSVLGWSNVLPTAVAALYSSPQSPTIYIYISHG